MVHIVVVDDSPADRTLIEAAFSEAFQCRDVFKLHALDNGDGVIQYLKEKIGGRPPELIILDLNLPGRDGIDVLKELKAHPLFRNIPVVIFSTSEADEDVRAAYAHFANSYIVKPLN